MEGGWLPHAAVVGVSLAAVVLSVALHYEVLLMLGRHFARLHREQGRPRAGRRTVLKIMTGLFGLHVLEIWLFGAAYWGLLMLPGTGSIEGTPHPHLLEAVYFSAVTFTTVGFGDLSPVGPVRFLAGTEALIGFMLITWSASFTYLQMARHWREDESA